MSYNKNNHPIIGRQPITLLEKVNLIDPKEYGSVTLEGYTVTEKADGERLLMYIDDINIYMINNTYNVITTGMKSLNLYND